ncbi:MAG: response regulator [Acidobacteriia bacterium]|nr:response regulator [Terriglobia bacterium]
MSAGTILVVDHHLEVLSILRAALTRYSYDVLTAGGGEEALDILASQAHVDLVVSEVLMRSGMSGPALVDKVRESYPATAVMLMTGFTDQQLDSSVPFLEKPFTAATLVGRVRQALVESRQAAEALQATCETNRALNRELKSVTSAVRQTIRQSRQKRSERFCRRLREPHAEIPIVLVAEDDAALRYSVCHFLSLLGFTVLEASDGQEALKSAREYRRRIDVLVTAVRMPGLNGLELANALAAERPRTRIIFTTADDVDLPAEALRKPFELDDLLAAIVGTLSNHDSLSTSLW